MTALPCSGAFERKSHGSASARSGSSRVLGGHGWCYFAMLFPGREAFLVRVLLFLLLFSAPTIIPRSAHAEGFDASAIKTFVASKPRPLAVKSTAQVKSNMLQLAIDW